MWIALVATLLLLLVGAIWLAGWFFGLSLAVKIGLTLLILGVAVLSFILVYLLRLQKARGVEHGIAEQGNTAANADPGKRDEILALQQQMQKAIVALKQSRLGARGGAAALYALPWYVIVGPPGAGKTTAIKHSGLSFPLDQGAAYRGTSGTKNCDWWFTNDAILLDTAGRYSTGDNEPEWLRFLDLLRKYRPRKPINGLIVAVSVLDLLDKDAAHIDGMGKQLRARIDEVTKHLKVLVPIYIIFTKTDLVAGFGEFWDDLRKSERGQIWGATIPLRSTLEPQVAFEQEFDLLVQALHGRALRRVGSERNPQSRHVIIHFPIEFSELKNSLSMFLGVLFQRNSFQETPAMRGVYFTSGMQTVRPMSRVLNAMSTALALNKEQQPQDQPQDQQQNQGTATSPPVAVPTRATTPPTGPAPAAAAAPPLESKSFFLTDVFFKNIFPDQNIVGHTAAEQRRQLALRLGIAAVTITTAACLLVPAVFTFSRNRDLVKTAASLNAGLESSTWNEGSKILAGGKALSDTESQLRQLDDWRGNHPVQLGWGMYTGDQLYMGLRGAYAATVDRAILNDVRSSLEDRLGAIVSAPVRTVDNFNRDFDQLKLYLMMSDPEHMDPAWAAPRLVRQRELTSRPRVPEEDKLFGAHVFYVCELLKRGEIPAWKLDKSRNELISRARSVLRQMPQQERLYEALVRDANTEIVPIRRETIFYGSIAMFVKSRNGMKVEGAYQKPGWDRVKALLGTEKAKLIAERWVLGEDEAQISQSMGTLREVYFERYKNAWRDFIGDLEIADPGNAEYALAQLNALAEPEWPYLRLIRALHDNVTLDIDEPEEDKTLLEKVAEKAAENAKGKTAEKVKDLLDASAPPPKKKTISPVEIAFRPILRFGIPAGVREGELPPATGLSQWEALVAKLIGGLTDLRDGQADTDQTKKMNDVFQEAFRTTSALLSDQDGFTRPLLSPLLTVPLTLSWSNVVRDASLAASSSWEVTVWPKWHDKLEGRYPFAQSRTDATLADFLQFFSPGDGALWSYYDESLKATLDRKGNTFTPSRRFKSSIGYRADFLNVCLKRGADFTEALFAPKADHAAVEFDVNLHSVSPSISQVTFEVDGVSHTYRNEPEQWTPMVWPSKDQHGAKLRVKGSGGLDEEVVRPGDFGLFRLLDTAKIEMGRAGGRADGTPTVVATWELRAAQKAVVSLDLRPKRNENPLNRQGYFFNYNCPRTITADR